MSLSEDWQNFSVNVWIINILGFVAYTISLTPSFHFLSFPLPSIPSSF